MRGGKRSRLRYRGEGGVPVSKTAERFKRESVVSPATCGGLFWGHRGLKRVCLKALGCL